MTTDLRVYDNEHGDPVVVMVTTGTFDVSRLAGLMAQGRCEDGGRAKAINRALSRHNGGRSALKLLAEHGGPDLLERVSEDIADPVTLSRSDLCELIQCSPHLAQPFTDGVRRVLAAAYREKQEREQADA